MAVHNLEVSTENLLSAVVRMPASEFERFFQNARKLKKREADLIAKLDEFNLSPEKEKLYGKLLKKFRAEKITPEEYEEMIAINTELEALNVERIKCLGEISKIRQTSLSEIVEELGIKPKNYG
ncbi:MAG: hypothetical protein ABJA66_03545 [Actinomycetota bacterium]